MKNLFAFLLFSLLHGSIYAQFEETEAQIQDEKFEEAYAYLISAKDYFIKNLDSVSVFECSEWVRMESLFQEAAANLAYNKKTSNDNLTRLIVLKMELGYYLPDILQIKVLRKLAVKDFYGAKDDCNFMIENEIPTRKKGFAYLCRGTCYMQFGEKAKGCSDFSKAGELGSEQAYKMIQEYCN